MGCEVGGLLCLGDGLGEVIGTAAGAIGFASDPFGEVFKKIKESAVSLAHDVFPALTAATLPDLTADWFLRAYAVSFALAIFVWVVLLIVQLIRTGRGMQGGRELFDSIGPYSALFFLGAMFGPAIGTMLVNFTHSLSDVLISWGLTGSTTATTERFIALIDQVDPATLTGGAFMAIILMLLMVLALFMVVLMLIVQLVTLYFTGVILPLGIVWVVDPTRREFGMRLVYLWLGLLLAHPLIFFLLGIGFQLVAGAGTFSNNPLGSFVKLIVSIIALFMAVFSPLLLMKFAPVIPMGGTTTAGPTLQGVGSTIGASKLVEASERNLDRRGSGGGTATTASTSSSTTTTAMGKAGLAEAAAAQSAGSASASAAGSLAAAGAAETATGAGAAIGVPTLIAAGAVKVGSVAVDAGRAVGDQALAPMDDQPTIGGDRP